MRLLTHDEREVLDAFTRVVFNVAFHDRDDHAKNFAWRLGRDRRWRLAPAFDLTLSDGPAGQHHLDVLGQGDHIDRETLLRLATAADLRRPAAIRAIDRVLSEAGSLGSRLAHYPVGKPAIERIDSAVRECCGLLAPRSKA